MPKLHPREELLALADATADTELAAAIRGIADDPFTAALELVRFAAYVGAWDELDGGDCVNAACETIEAALPGTVDPDKRDSWRQIADHLGHEHDGEPEDDDETEDDEA